MGRRSIGALIFIGIAVLCVVGWQKYRDKQQLAEGDVHCVGCMTPAEKSAFARKNSGDDSESGGSQRDLAVQEPRSTLPDTGATQGEMVAPPAQTATGFSPAPLPSRPSAPPANDSIAPNPPNGAAFAGGGTYQWYRQGNLTWRVDTATGRSCIIYATMEEWQKRIVMQHGCGREA